jgi:signal transduction histidine kinase
VWQTNQALVVPNYQQWSGKVEYLAGSVTALCMMGVPIRWEDTTYGVVTIVGHPGQQFITADVDLMTLFAAQAAVAIQRTHQTNTIKRQVEELEQEVEQRNRIEKELRRSEEEAREFQEKLQALHEVNIELSRCASLEELYRRTIELGRERLGFDRLGLLLIEEETNMMLGTFGTDENGQLRDERFFRQAQENPDITGILTEQKRIGFWEDTSLKDAGEVVGRGWNAMTVLWNGNKGIGWLATDNLIRREPPTAVQLEILTLYGAALGQLVSRKKVEEERERLIEELEAKNAELERFTYTVSHDLKSPLVTVKGFLGFLERDAGQRNWEGVWKDVGRIREATDKMEELLRDLLELSRVGRVVNAPQQVGFREIAQEALSLVRGRVNERGVKVEIASDLPTVIVDKPRLVEVMQNLLDNGVKFMGDQPEPKIVVGTKQEAGETLFFVADNGKGIEQRYYDKVFGLFERLDQSVEGTGIGLALVKRIVEVHNGRIWVESDGKGKGTTFLFTLPIHHES